MTSRKQKKKHTFVLRDINPVLIDKKYGIPYLNSDDIPDKSTKITELLPFSSNLATSKILDEQIIVSMHDAISKQELTGSTCFWCRLSFTEQPIGCPIRYVPNRTTKVCTSESTKDKYTLTQTIPDYETNGEGSYYQTDGCFCSFNCCLAFIEDQRHNPYYQYSKELMYQMYLKTIGRSRATIYPAPSWRLLKEYGGPLNHDEFRQSFQTYAYVDKNVQLVTIPHIQPVGHLYERKYIF